MLQLLSVAPKKHAGELLLGSRNQQYEAHTDFASLHDFSTTSSYGHMLPQNLSGQVICSSASVDQRQVVSSLPFQRGFMQHCPIALLHGIHISQMPFAVQAFVVVLCSYMYQSQMMCCPAKIVIRLQCLFSVLSILLPKQIVT